MNLWSFQREVIDSIIERTASPLSSGNTVEWLRDTRTVFDRMQQRIRESSGWLGLFAYEWDDGSLAQSFVDMLTTAAGHRNVLVGLDGFGSHKVGIGRRIAHSGADVFVRRPQLHPWAKRPPLFGRPLFSDRRKPSAAPHVGHLRASRLFPAADCCWGAHAKLFITGNQANVGDVDTNTVAIVAGNQIRDRWTEHLPNGETLVADHGAELRGPAVKVLAAEMLRSTELARRLKRHGYEKHPNVASKYSAQLRALLDDIDESTDFSWHAPDRPAAGMMQVIASEPLADRARATALYDCTEILYQRARGGRLTIVSSVMNLPHTRLRTICQMASDTEVIMVLNRVDDWAIRFAAVRQYESLLQAGVKIFEMHGGRQLHGKLSVYENADTAFAVQSGSSNANVRSLLEDKETDWISYDPTVIREGAELADWYITRSDPVSLDDVEALLHHVTPRSLLARSRNLIYQRFT